MSENVTVAPAPEAMATPNPAPETVVLAPTEQLEKVFNRRFTEADLGAITSHAESRENPALDKLLDNVDAVDPAVVNQALEDLYKWYSLEAGFSKPGSSLRSRLKKATLDATARQAPAPAPAPAPTAPQITSALIAQARKSGIEPTVAQVLAAHGITV